jgi:choline dehydrogenase-like flavoprotein
MLLTDGRLPSHAHDCFIVGSGPAGLSVGLALAEAGRRVLVFESGQAGPAQRDLSNSIGYGHYSAGYWNLHWSRALGGTTDVWSGWCTTLRAIDFDNPAVGVRWPITRDELLPYYGRAAPLLDHDPAYIDFEAPLLPGFRYRPVPIAAPTRFGPKYAEPLRASGRIDVALGCSVVSLTANEGRSALVRLEYVHHESGVRRGIEVTEDRNVVLAAGGIGNAQLLLQPAAGSDVPVGNESGHAGRFLMEHPHFNRAGELAIDEELDRYWPATNTGRGAHALVAEDELVRRDGLHACSLQCSRKTTEHEMAQYLTREYGRPFYHYVITSRSEMLPSAANRVFLTGERDRSGLFRPGVRCVLDARDLLNVERTLRALGDALLQQRKGRVRVNNDRIYRQVDGGGHTLGTTRMGPSRATSVVDRDCRVHGYANLFVAGSSVFPSGGYANPTLTIVALGLRLADRLVRTGTAQ